MELNMPHDTTFIIKHLVAKDALYFYFSNFTPELYGSTK